MSRIRITIFVALGAVAAFLLILSLTPLAGAGGLANSAAATSVRTNQGQAIAQAVFQRQQFTPWTPRPPLLPQYAPLWPTLELSTTTWTSIGPSPLAITSPANANFNVSGRITAIAAHPTDANTIYIAAAGGGVWKTTNGGTTWTPLTDTQRTLSMGAIAIAKSNPSVIYAGTGEANNSGDSNFGRGILVSTNGGTTWTLRTAAGAFDRLATSQIAVDPTNANVAYAAMADFANNGLCCANTGIWKTIDGGTTWTNTTTTIDSTRPWSAIVIDPTTPATLYAAHGEYDGDSANGVYKSINSGGTWTLLPTHLTEQPRAESRSRLPLQLPGSVCNCLGPGPALFWSSVQDRALRQRGDQLY